MRDELFSYMLGGHDTISTLLTYALWALGHHLNMQHILVSGQIHADCGIERAIGALLAKAHGDEAGYRDYRDRYRALATSLGFEGHMKWAEAMT